LPFRKGEYYARRREQAQRHRLKAIEALARGRRLASVQVTIGPNQINVARCESASEVNGEAPHLALLK
jgi:hypothetical protein